MIKSGIIRLVNGVIVIIFAMQFYINNCSAQDINVHETEKPTECLRFYGFVIDEYVKLIQTVYEGDEPFFVLVTHLFCNEPGVVTADISITYTQLYQNISPLIGKYYYPYSYDSSVFVILDIEEDSWQRYGLSPDHFPKASIITEEVLKQVLFPLTEEYDMEYNQPKPDNVIFYNFYSEKNDKFSVSKSDNGIHSQVNNKNIVYFMNYPEESFKVPPEK